MYRTGNRDKAPAADTPSVAEPRLPCEMLTRLSRRQPKPMPDEAIIDPKTIMRRDPRVALSVEAGSHNAMGLAEYLVVHGRARITEGGAPELLQQLARTYLGPDVKFPPMDDPPSGYITHITVERIGGVGPGPSGRLIGENGPTRLVVSSGLKPRVLRFARKEY